MTSVTLTIFIPSAYEYLLSVPHILVTLSDTGDIGANKTEWIWVKSPMPRLSKSLCFSESLNKAHYYWPTEVNEIESDKCCQVPQGLDKPSKGLRIHLNCNGKPLEVLRREMIQPDLRFKVPLPRRQVQRPSQR